jgi:ATP-dependent Lhr-like helicase
MVAEGFATRRGRRGALLHRDEVNGKVRGRRGSRMLAITSGGAIPEVADYRVVLEPEDTFIGTLNEDFAIESMAGDIFQLGNSSWQVLQVGSGFVRVADAKGAPPNIPFWLGEAPARSDELSRAVSDLRADFEKRLSVIGSRLSDEEPRTDNRQPTTDNRELLEWLIGETGIPEVAAREILTYLTEGRQALGVLPTQDTLVLERFFDESGGMQVVLHAPFGSRINKAWGLALRKRFCRQFNFELQAAATEDAVLLSLGPQHSFPLADVFRYLHPNTARDVLVQAFLDAPVWKTRWRWNTTISLAVPRNRGGQKVPPQLQRMMADDLMAAVFPDAVACLENVAGDRKLPDHPLVNQAVRDCLQEAMDFEGLAAVLTRIHRGEIRCVARDTPEPSPLSHEILNAKPYAFLDDAPLEERRTQAVYAGRSGDASILDREAIERVREEARPDPRDADELHDALLTIGFLTEDEASRIPPELFDALVAARRAGPVASLWVAAERLPEILAIDPAIQPGFQAPASRASRVWTREEAIVELIRGRMTMVGPVTALALARSLGIGQAEADAALLALESEGAVLRGTFTPVGERESESARERESESAKERESEDSRLEWCDRRLLARIHRYTLNRLRAEIEPVSPADFMRFLFAWQHAAPSMKLAGPDGLRQILVLLDGYETAADAWERFVLPSRLDRYEPSMLDMLCLTGQVGWARLSSSPSAVIGATPVALFLRENAEAWQSLRPPVDDGSLSDLARRIREILRARGASFLRELATACAVDEAEIHRGIGELVSAGLVTSDGFAGLRTLVRSGYERPGRKSPADTAGRWSLLHAGDIHSAPPPALEMQARALLRRYGVVFRRLLTRETNAAPWRELARVYRRLEARGEIRGGRFVAGMSGEQFALGEAVDRLREIRREGPDGRLIVISAADPLNLAGILTSSERIRAVASNRIAYRDGVAVSVMEGDYLRPLAEIDPATATAAAIALAGRRVPVASGYVGRSA